MKLIHIGQCENVDCARFEADRCQLWLLGRKLLCWFCWRERLGIAVDHDTIAKQYGEPFAEMVTMSRAFGQRRGAA